MELITECFSEFESDITDEMKEYEKAIDIRSQFNTWFSDTNHKLTLMKNKEATKKREEENRKKEEQIINTLKEENIKKLVDLIIQRITYKFSSIKTLDEYNEWCAKINDIKFYIGSFTMNDHLDFADFIDDIFSEFKSDCNLLTDYTENLIDISTQFKAWFEQEKARFDLIEKSSKTEYRRKIREYNKAAGVSYKSFFGAKLDYTTSLNVEKRIEFQSRK